MAYSPANLISSRPPTALSDVSHPQPEVRSHLAELSVAMDQAKTARDAAAAKYATIATAAEELAELTRQHQAALQQMLATATTDLSAYGDHLYAANRLAQRIEAARREVDIDACRAAAKRVDEANAVLAHCR